MKTALYIALAIIGLVLLIPIINLSVPSGMREVQTEKGLNFPPPVEIATPKSDLSAREAMELLKPVTAVLDPSWSLYELHGHAHRSIDHPEQAVPSSDWEFRYVNPAGDVIGAWLHSNGNGGRAGIHSLWTMPPEAESPPEPEKVRAIIAQLAGRPDMDEVSRELERMLEKPAQRPRLELPQNWMDSLSIAEIVAALDPPQELPKPGASLFSLLWGALPEARWQVRRVDNRKHWVIEINAVTGEVLRQTVGWTDENDNRIKPRRERIKGGPWHDL